MSLTNDTLWTAMQWEAATMHLLYCEIENIADCRFCTAIKQHVDSEVELAGVTEGKEKP